MMEKRELDATNHDSCLAVGFPKETKNAWKKKKRIKKQTSGKN